MASANTVALDDETFDAIFNTDLIYAKDCWELCGDAHCCHFDRYRKFAGDSERGFQKIPLLTGEYEYMKRRGLLNQYSEFEREVTCVTLVAGEFNFDLLSIPADRACPCDHSRRPTICRLYPLMPILSPTDKLIGVDANCSQFEVVEDLGGMQRACQLTGTSFVEFGKFITICTAISRNPRTMFSAMFLHLFLVMFRSTIKASMKKNGVTVFQAIQTLAGQESFVDQAKLADELDSLTNQFQAEFGPDFSPC